MGHEFINIGIAVNDIEEAVKRFEAAFGWKLDGDVTTQPGLGIKFAVLKTGTVDVELLSPLPGERTLRKFLDTRGEGLYRLAFATKDMDETLAHLGSNEVAYVDVTAAAQGAGDRIVFTHPKSAHGVMLEYVEREVSR